MPEQNLCLVFVLFFKGKMPIVLLPRRSALTLKSLRCIYVLLAISASHKGSVVVQLLLTSQ